MFQSIFPGSFSVHSEDRGGQSRTCEVQVLELVSDAYLFSSAFLVSGRFQTRRPLACLVFTPWPSRRLLIVACSSPAVWVPVSPRFRCQIRLRFQPIDKPEWIMGMFGEKMASRREHDRRSVWPGSPLHRLEYNHSNQGSAHSYSRCHRRGREHRRGPASPLP